MKNIDLRAKGQQFKYSKECEKCGEDIEMWQTASGNWAAYNVMTRSTDEVVPHRETCSG